MPDRHRTRLDVDKLAAEMGVKPPVPRILPEPGDILAHYRVHTLGQAAIDVGEALQDGAQPDYYFHVAIALDAYTQLAAIAGTGVTTLPIRATDHYQIFRPPIPWEEQRSALAAVKALKGQRYDRLLIVDDALRMLTRGVVHLPDMWVRSEERTHKICSSLVVRYFRYAAWSPPMPLSYRSTPEDVGIALRKWRVQKDSARG